MLARRPRDRCIQIVTQMLMEYPALRAAVKLEEELEREGLSNLYPSAVAVYGTDAPRGTTVNKPTEKWGIRRLEWSAKALQVRQIERALEVLSEDERRLIEMRYLSPTIMPDKAVYQEMKVTAATGKRMKRRALLKIARVLGIC